MRVASKPWHLMFTCCSTALILLLSCASAYATAASISVGSGTLSYTETTTTPTCASGGTKTTFTEFNFTNFSFVANGTTYAGSSGGGSFFISPGNGCPNPGPQPASGGVVVVNGPGFTVTFFPCGGTDCSATITAFMYPQYEVQSIVYAAPGNHSSDGFVNSTTDGTYSSFGNTFTNSVSETFSATGGFLGTGSTLSWDVGSAITKGNSTISTTTITQGTGVSNNSNNSSPNTMNHAENDLFIVWLNPAVKVTQTGTSALTYSVGTQSQSSTDPSPGQPQSQDQVEVFAGNLIASSTNNNLTTVPVNILEPQNVDNQSLPGLAIICKNHPFYPNSCTRANQCGCVPSDFTGILNTDPLLNFTSTENPLNADTSGATACTNPTSSAKCRYVPIMTSNGSDVQQTELLQGPGETGGNLPANMFTASDATQTTQIYSESLSETVGFSWSGGFNVLGTGFSFKTMDQFTWTQSEATGEINGYAHTQNVTLSSSTVGCSEHIPIFEDTVYHTFVFQQPAGDTSCP